MNPGDYDIQFTWMEENNKCVLPARRQRVNDCWAHAVTACVYSDLVLNHPDEPALEPSVQELVDRMHLTFDMPPEEMEESGLGANVVKAYQYFIRYGVYPAANVPYQSICQTSYGQGEHPPFHRLLEDGGVQKIYIANFEKIKLVEGKSHFNIADVKPNLMKKPMSAVFVLPPSYFTWPFAQKYVFELPDSNHHEWRDRANWRKHAAQVIGWGFYGPNQEVFLQIMNSWGAKHGKNGTSGIPLSLAMSFSYPIGSRIGRVVPPIPDASIRPRARRHRLPRVNPLH